LADPKLSVCSSSLPPPHRLLALLWRARGAASLGSDAQNMSGGEGAVGRRSGAVPRKKRRSS
jgi:hypothetical protein